MHKTFRYRFRSILRRSDMFVGHLICSLALWHSAFASKPAPSTGESVPPVIAIEPTTYCNPLSLPDYPIGRKVRNGISGVPSDTDRQWRLEKREQFRELADPTALWHEGKWYLYPSCDMAWVSNDEGLTWQHHPLNIRDIGYAPTIVKHGDRFLLTATGLELYTSISPLGPFERLGKINLPKVPGTSPFAGDPMLFSDNGHLYLYVSFTATSGIWAAELDPQNPLVAISKPICAIPFQPDLHPWEAAGNWNENLAQGWLEGAWMVKVRDRYYLTYAAAGTENRTYAMGCYIGDTPLGPFTPQKRNPIFRSVAGLITGTAHGSIVAGPRDRLWAFYCIRADVAHAFERRIGFDLAAIDVHGELYVPEATSLPQRLPPAGASSTEGAPAGWVPLNDDTRTLVSSSAPNLGGRFAVDHSITTWWQPAEADPAPVLTTSFDVTANVHAVRVIWRDIGLDTKAGVSPGPFRYRVEVETQNKTWTTIIDRSASQEDLLIDYRECTPVIASRARLVILGSPHGITPGVVEFTVFGDKAAKRSATEQSQTP